MKNLMLLVVIFLSSCSLNLNRDEFLLSMTGQYLLTATGNQFLRVALDVHLLDSNHLLKQVQEGTTLEMRGDGSMHLIFSETQSQDISQFISQETETEGIFQFLDTMDYFAMSKQGILLIATKDIEANIDNLLLENLIPIAREVIE